MWTTHWKECFVLYLCFVFHIKLFITLLESMGQSLRCTIAPGCVLRVELCGKWYAICLNFSFGKNGYKCVKTYKSMALFQLMRYPLNTNVSIFTKYTFPLSVPIYSHLLWNVKWQYVILNNDIVVKNHRLIIFY